MAGRLISQASLEPRVRRGFRWCALCFATLVSSSLAAAEEWSAPLKKAQELLNHQNYSRAYTEYLHHAEKKNPLAQFSIALFHEFGWGRTKDPATACRWYKRASRAKLPAAQHFLGDCLMKGLNGPADPARAAVLYEDAAQGGHWISRCALAELYQSGAGVPKDPARGVALCEQVASQGIVKAMRMTAILYLDGDPNLRDPAKGRIWLEQAAQRGDAEAQYRLGLLGREDGPPLQNLERARHWFESAAAQGYGPAYFPAAELYFSTLNDPTTRQPPPEILAKAYLWLSAAIRRAPSIEEARQAEKMLGQVEAIMPGTWKLELDEKLARHFASFPLP